MQEGKNCFMINTEGVLDSFLEYEKNNKLFEKKIGDFAFWPYIRMDVYNQLFDLNLIIKPKRKKIKIAYNIFLNSMINNPYKIKDIDVLFINSPRKFADEKNIYQDIYLDDILTKATYKYSILECIDIVTGGHLKPCENQENLYFRDYLDAKVFINSLFMKNNSAITVRVYEIIKDIEKVFNKKINIELLVSIANKKYKQWKASKKVYSYFFEKVKPKIIVEICSYNTSNMIFNELAHEKKIPVIELQHGVMGKGHLAYNYGKHEKHKFFPDYIFLFSDFWKQYTKLPLENDKIIVTGFPYLEKKINANNIQKEKTNTILFVSQPTIGEKLFEIALDLSKLLNEKYKIIFKLHPSEANELILHEKKLRSNRINNILVAKNTNISIYEYFNKCSIQVGYTSTAIYESLAFNLKTYIYKDKLSELYMEDLCEMNYAEYFTNAEELALKIKNKKSKDIIDKEFWAKDSIENINSNLLKIMNKESE